jgi:N4-gp56 family major capsid protein
MNSHVPAGSDKAMYVQSAGMFALAENRGSRLGQLSGPLPKGEGKVAEMIRKQSSADYPIVKSMDLSRGMGDEVEFHFVQPTKMRPTMGSRMVEGKGKGMAYDKSRIRVDQARIPVKLGDNMTNLRSAVDFTKLARPVAQSHANAYLDQSILTHLGGARGFHDNNEWRVPTEDDPEFAEMLVNPVKAPTKNRHFMADGSNGLKGFTVNAGEAVLATTDELSMTTVDAMRTLLESVAMPPPAVKIPGDIAAEDEPLRAMLLSPAQYHAFAQDDAFRKFQVAAMNRASNAKKHPLFLGECGLWNGILLLKQPKPIRFYAGNTIRYCNSYTSEAESTCTVPASFGVTHAVDRAILLGGQSLMQAFAAAGLSGMPFFWNEETFDHKDKRELIIGVIQGLAKIRFAVDQGNGTKHWTDIGAMALDTVVKLIPGER